MFHVYIRHVHHDMLAAHKHGINIISVFLLYNYYKYVFSTPSHCSSVILDYYCTVGRAEW